MTNTVTPEMTMELLEEAGVNKEVISFLKKNPTLLHEKIKEVIGTDYAPEVSHFKTQYVQKIKDGNDSFKILDNGDIWVSNFTTTGGKSFYDGLFRDPADKYKNITENITLTSDEGHIVKRTITHKGFVQDGQYCYDGSILQENFDNNNNLVSGFKGSWENSQSMDLPKDVYVFSFVNNSFTNIRETQMDGHYINTGTPEWQLTSTGEISKTDIQEMDNDVNNPIIGRLKLIKDKAQQFLSAKTEKKEKSYEQELKGFQEMERDLLGHPNSDGIVSTEEILTQVQRDNYSTYSPRQR